MLRRVQKAVTVLPDLDFGHDEAGRKIVLSCHILARAVGKAFGLRHVDGYFYPNFQHSWLTTDAGNVIDVYPVGILGGPILVAGPATPAGWLYEKKRVLRGQTKMPSFRQTVRIVAAELRKAAND
jgi:hypothetical protein